MAATTRERAAFRFLIAVALGAMVSCNSRPIGEPGLGEVRHFELGDAFYEIGTTNPLFVIQTYLCTDCTAESFDGLVPEHGLEKSPVWRLEARSAELRKLPTDADFIGFVDGAGHHFQHDARSVSPPLLGGAIFPCGSPFWGESCGTIIRLESDRTFRFAAGDLVHELHDGPNRYVLYAVVDKNDLANLELPPGWTQLTRRLDGEMIMTSNGFQDVYQDVRKNLWQRLSSASEARKSDQEPGEV
jgi:hypothetical protein